MDRQAISQAVAKVIAYGPCGKYGSPGKIPSFLLT